MFFPPLAQHIIDPCSGFIESDPCSRELILKAPIKRVPDIKGSPLSHASDTFSGNFLSRKLKRDLYRKNLGIYLKADLPLTQNSNYSFLEKNVQSTDVFFQLSHI